MKNKRSLSKAALVSIFIVCVSFIAKGQYDSIVHNGKNRTYLLHLPQSYTGEKTLPLVIAMHGGFGNAFGIRKMSGLSEKSDTENFIVVYPEGVKSNLDIRTWNAGWCCGFASRNNINDVGFINKLIDHLLKNYSIDSNQIYATGMSNGGLMSYRLACELSSKITAIAPVAATMTMNSCNPAKSVPLIAFHSFLDENIPYEGGTGEGASNHHNPPQDSVMQVWSNNNQCQQIADTLVNNSKYLHIKWHSCNCNSQIHHYTTHDGGHSWPGGEKTKNGDSVSKYINATDLMWSFFSKA